jgi:hypothetical protein
MGLSRSPLDHIAAITSRDSNTFMIEGLEDNDSDSVHSDASDNSDDSFDMPGLVRRELFQHLSDSDDSDDSSGPPPLVRRPNYDSESVTSDTSNETSESDVSHSSGGNYNGNDGDSVPPLDEDTSSEDSEEYTDNWRLDGSSGNDPFITRDYTADRPSRGALLDRGANGGIIGNDARILRVHNVPAVGVTGIYGQGLQSLMLVDAYAKISTQKGDIIGIFNQYAFLGEGKSIHSVLQIESHYGNRVNERPYSMGGSQHVLLNGGYVVPVDIICGLPYIAMTQCTRAEFYALPHVTFTDSSPWNPNIFDCRLSVTQSWHEFLEPRIERDNKDYSFYVDIQENSEPLMSSSGAEYTAHAECTERLRELADLPANKAHHKCRGQVPL